MTLGTVTVIPKQLCRAFEEALPWTFKTLGGQVVDSVSEELYIMEPGQADTPPSKVAKTSDTARGQRSRMADRAKRGRRTPSARAGNGKIPTIKNMLHRNHSIVEEVKSSLS